MENSVKIDLEDLTYPPKGNLSDAISKNFYSKHSSQVEEQCESVVPHREYTRNHGLWEPIEEPNRCRLRCSERRQLRQLRQSGDVCSRPKEKGTTIHNPFNDPHLATKVQSMSKGKKKMIISDADNDDSTDKFDDNYFTNL
ncbi:hypothetical protein J1N35_041223 [Gossypium stocksii]|uniref:Uncharacterized protein n=1 Tax=Gossypium stocksii TaxID=47602 RepID=A0A9D3UF77_9ROSI|nr:hypothetical protein J1N35_041223 [Gossypium stocksii]